MNDLTEAKKSYDCSDLSTEEMNKILPAYDIAATDALWANATMSEGCDDDISDIQFKDEEVEESLIHMQDETTFNPLVTAETLKVGDLVYDEKSGHKLKVAAIEAKDTWSRVITWKDIDTNSISQTQTGNNALFELVVDGDTAYEVDDDIELEVHPIDTYFEGIKEDMENVTNEEIRLDVVNNIVDALHSMGYDDDFIGSYVHVEVKDTEDGRVKVEVRGEFNYDELFELTNRLDKVISKYDKHAYFDMEEAGIASAYLLKDQSGYIVNEELVNAFKDIIDKCATKEELKKVYVERIKPLSENNTLNQGTYDAVLDLVDKKLDLFDGKPVNEELEETAEDGWGEEVAKVLEDVFDKMDRISYEVKNTVRGSYVGGKTVGDLVYELNDVKDMLEDAIDELEDNADRINESTLNEGPGAGYTIKSSGYDVNEVIVVDNSANNVLKGKYKNCITIWEKKSGLSNARNCGAHLAKNNLMFFLDDDLILPNDFFESLIDYRNIENELVGFKITPEFIPDYLPQKYWYLVGYKNLYTKKTVLKKDEYLGGCALLMSKKIYNDIGGFNSKFGHTRENMGANEDVLFQQQALKKKYTIIFEPKIDIIHCWNGSYESLLKRIEIQARNDYQTET